MSFAKWILLPGLASLSLSFSSLSYSEACEDQQLSGGGQDYFECKAACETSAQTGLGCLSVHHICDSMCLGGQYDGEPGDDETGSSDVNTCNPINLSTGNKYLEELDYQAGGPFPLTFRRFYNSYIQAWRHSYRQNIEYTNDPNVVIANRPDGRAIHFTLTDGEYQPADHVSSRLSREGDEWVYVSKDDLTEVFNENGKLQTITNRDGLQHRMEYFYTHTAVTHTNGYRLTLTFDNSNRLRSLEDPEGGMFHYQWASDDHIVKLFYPDGSSTNYEYDDSRFPHHITRVIDQQNRVVLEVEYDDEGRAVMSQLGDGHERITVEYIDEYQRRVTNAMDKEALFTFQDIGQTRRLVKVDGAAAEFCIATTANYTYDGNGYANRLTDANGNVVDLDINDRGLLDKQVEAAGTAEQQTTEMEWHDEFRLPVLIRQPSKTTELEYNNIGQLVRRTEIDTTNFEGLYHSANQQRDWFYGYHAAGQPGEFQLSTIVGPKIEVAGSENDISFFRYDSSGNLIERENAAGHITSFSDYDGHKRAGRIVDPNGVTRLFSYDEFGRLVQVEEEREGGNLLNTIEYNSVGLVEKITLQDGSFVEWDYDKIGQIIEMRNNGGERVDYSYNALGTMLLERTFNDRGQFKRQRQQLADELGQVRAVLGADGQEQVFTFDGNGNPLTLTETSAAGEVTVSYQYDHLDRLTQIVAPLSRVIDFEYDLLNNVRLVRDAKGVETRYIFDGFGQLMEVDSPDQGISQFRYDVSGNMVEQVDARGVQSLYDYDAIQRIQSVEFPADPSKNIYYEYDQADKGVGYLSSIRDASGETSIGAYDSHGNVLFSSATVDTVSATVEYRYDALDRVVGMIYPSGREITFERDAVGKLWRITSQLPGQAQQTLVENIIYFPFGPVNSWQFGNGVTRTMNYDLDYRPKTLLSQGSAGNIQNTIYEFDEMNLLLEIDDRRTPELSQQFSYDALTRVNRAEGLYGDIDYAYDAVDNRTQRQTLLTGISQVENYHYDDDSHRLQNVVNATGAILRQFVYDGMGNLTQDDQATGGIFELEYGVYGRLEQVVDNNGQLVEYQYNALGQRVLKHVAADASANRTYWYDQQGLLIAEIDLQGVVKQEYVYLDNQPIAVFVEDHQARAAADLDVQLSQQIVGLAAEYQFTVLNQGPNSALNSELLIAMPNGAIVTDIRVEEQDIPERANLRRTSVSAEDCQTDGIDVVCQFGDVMPGKQVLVTLQVTLASEDNHQVGAHLSSSTEDPNPANNTIAAKSSAECMSETLAAGKNDKALAMMRRYRDDVLYQSASGQQLARVYYQISPTIAAALQENPALLTTLKTLALPAFSLLSRSLSH